ncbi:MAG: ABC transporter ATP-binding protein/permease [Candidatus Gastranaerophilales bacterium]|nr:ABC transporter ATP-binding protein/permease [Candidatus Gastranaerophilales bacterium]MCM1072475.1 ABC transporter ATP-binding protein/permease [Bacteroides sp.]
MEDSLLKLKNTNTKDAFRYGYLLNKMYPYIKTVLGRSIILILLAIPLGLLDGVVAFSLRPYMDYVVNGNEAQIFEFHGHTLYLQAFFIKFIPFAIVVFALIQGVLKYLCNYLTEWTGNTMSNNLKIDLFKKLTAMDTKFYDINSSGLILSRFLSDPDQASKKLIETIKTFILSIFELVALVGVLLFNSWKLAIIGVGVMAIAITPVTLIRKKIKKVSNDTMVVAGDMTTNFNETCAGNKIVTAYNLQDSQNHKFEGQVKKQFNLAMSLTKRVGWMSPIMYFICSIGIAIVMNYGNSLILSGEMTAGSFASFVTSLLLLYKPTKTLGLTLTNLQGTFVSMARVFELFDLMPEIKNQPHSAELKNVGEIDFNHVTFEYKKDIPVLKDFNLSVKPNETIALVGNSGGGKSTVVNLIPRFYDVKSGSIMINGIDIRQYDIVSLRNSISFVFQDNYLFSGTIRENILMGRPDASEEEIANAVKLAHLDEFLGTLPEGIDTVVGERGASLSGGQRQRVAIARALIKNSPIVILDEATSALDNESEAIVQKALDNLMQNRTVFVIAHRLSTIHNADRIAVLNEGELVELGTHSELINKPDGRYKYLYEMQFAGV